MAGTYDEEQQRLIDRIKRIAFREAKDAGASFINREWIARKLHRTKRWVSDWWTKSPLDCFVEYPGRTKEAMSEENKNIVLEGSREQKKSCTQIVREILERREKTVSKSTVLRYRAKEGLKAFHVIAKPLKTDTHIADRLWLCDWLSDWDQNDFLHLAPDEFFVWCVRKPNHQNERVWAKKIEAIEASQRYREMVRNQTCVGIFVMFTVKKLMFVVKEQGQSWDGEYFRETVLKANVIPFLKNPENVISVNDVTFLHDKAPCMKARATQMLLRSEDIDFWGNDIWPGNSPDLNAAEHIGAIIKDEVETRIIADVGLNRYSYETLKAHVEEVLKSLENRTDLFEQLLLSYPNRLEAVRQANGGHTDY